MKICRGSWGKDIQEGIRQVPQMESEKRTKKTEGKTTTQTCLEREGQKPDQDKEKTKPIRSFK